MSLYLTGLLIDCAAVLAVGGFYLYYAVRKREFVDPRIYFWLILSSISGSIVASGYFIWVDDLTTASILVWLMAVPVLVTCVFILLIIIFRPNWR